MLVMAVRAIDTRHNIALKARLHMNIVALRASRNYRRPLQEPSCSPDTPAGLVHRTFRYRDGRVCEVAAHAKAMVGLMRAMLQAPTIEVTQPASSPYSGSYRTFQQQNSLYQAYLNGDGHRAANPCSGYHRQGRAFDLVQPLSPREHDAMASVRVEGERFFNGLSFDDPAHWTLGALG